MEIIPQQEENMITFKEFIETPEKASCEELANLATRLLCLKKRQQQKEVEKYAEEKFGDEFVEAFENAYKVAHKNGDVPGLFDDSTEEEVRDFSARLLKSLENI
jgi:methionyl-tRNA synthetase